MNTYSSIEEYIHQFPKPVQEKLERVRQVIQQAAPTAHEAISYGIPTFKLHGNLVHFAAYENHLSFYPGPTGINAFKSELSQYKTSTGTIQFPLDEEIPYELILKITSFRVKESQPQS